MTLAEAMERLYAAFKQKREAQARARGWPTGWFEATAGSIEDPSFARPAQGEYEARGALD